MASDEAIELIQKQAARSLFVIKAVACMYLLTARQPLEETVVHSAIHNPFPYHTIYTDMYKQQ